MTMRDLPLSTLADPACRPLGGAFLQHGLVVDSGWHVHDMHQLQYAFDGSIEVEDERARHLLPRQLCAWIPASVAHRTRLHRVRSTSILLAPSLIGDTGDRVRIVQVGPLMREMIAGAMRWPLSEPQDEVGVAYFAAFALLCAEWIRQEATLCLPTTQDRALRAAMDHTLSNLCDVDMTAACAVAGMSERSLRRRFRAEVGMTWEDYRRRARLLRSVELLADTRAPIGEVAAEVGFESQSAFAKAFRAMTGRTPRSFRREP